MRCRRKKSSGEWLIAQRRTRRVRCRWGMLDVPVIQYRHQHTGKCVTTFSDDQMDRSGWLPHALDFLIAIVTELPAGVAESLCHKAGFVASRADLERLVSDWGGTVRYERQAALEAQAFEPLLPALPSAEGRVMVAQLDGCIVLGQPEDGRCPGIEVKAVMVYPELAPQQRVLHADVCSASDFQPACVGLLREAGVRQNDTLVGLGDGAAWVSATLKLMSAQVVLDVYHAVEYVDSVMQELGWDDRIRQEERQAWLRGQRDAATWLNMHLPTKQGRQGWSETGCNAARYLLERVEQMHYPTYRARGWPIGSGQIEGANKSVIGHRMKRSGQHWSREGAAGMAALRARSASVTHPLPFHTLRKTAFPAPHF